MSDEGSIVLRCEDDGCASRPMDRLAGQTIRAALGRLAPGHPLGALRVWLHVPIGGAELDAIARLRADVLMHEDWLEIDAKGSGVGLVIPNLIAGHCTRNQVRVFAHLRDRSGLLADGLGFGWDLSWSRLLAAWEASLPGSASPLEISVGCGHWLAAMPNRIDLGSIERPTRSSSASRHPTELCRLRMVIGTLRSRGVIARSKGAVVWVRRHAQSALNEGGFVEAAAILTVHDVYAERRSGRSLETAERICRSIAALANEAQRTLTGISPDIGTEAKPATSADIVARSCLAEQFTHLGVPLSALPMLGQRDRSRKKGRELSDPCTAFQTFGILDGPIPDPRHQPVEAAQRVVRCLLLHHGRRARCLLSLGLDNFADAIDPTTGRRLVDVSVVDTKTGSEADCWVPADVLWPSRDFEFLLRFLDWWRDTPTARGRNLLDLAGVPIDPMAGTDKAYRQMRSTLKARGHRLAFHDGRHAFATWFPIRILAAEYPEILNLPALQGLRRCPWFEPDSLDRLRSFLVGAGWSIELARRTMGHKHPGEFIETYCIAMPLIMSVRTWLASRQSGVEAVHQFLLRVLS